MSSFRGLFSFSRIRITIFLTTSNHYSSLDFCETHFSLYLIHFLLFASLCIFVNIQTNLVLFSLISPLYLSICFFFLQTASSVCSASILLRFELMIIDFINLRVYMFFSVIFESFFRVRMQFDI